MRVLYVESLRFNVQGYIHLAEAVRGFMEVEGIPYKGFEKSLANSHANLLEIERLLRDGITELPVPEKKS